MLWSVLIATLDRRQDQLLGLLGVLLPQVQAVGDVEVVACYNDGSTTLGDIRQALLDDARGEYVSFVDDDDMVAGGYVSILRAAMSRRPDCIGFEVVYTEAPVPGWDGEKPAGPPQRVVCSIACDGWYDEDSVLYRDLTIVQPVRASLARLGDFRAHWPEDRGWTLQVRPHLSTEVFAGVPLYFYRHNWRDSVQAGCQPPNAHPPRPDVDAEGFRWLTQP